MSMATSRNPTCRIYIVNKNDKAKWIPLCNEYRKEKGLEPYPEHKNFGCECNKAIKKTGTDPKLWNQAVQFYKKKSENAWVDLAVACKLHLGQSNASKIALVQAVMTHYNNNFQSDTTSTTQATTLAKNDFVRAILVTFVRELHKNGVVPEKKFPKKKMLTDTILASTQAALLQHMVRILSHFLFLFLLLLS